MEAWQRFSGRCRRAVIAAHNEAARMGTPLVSSEHLLLGVLAISDGTAVKVLQEMEVSGEALIEELRAHQVEGEAVSSRELSFTPEAQRVLHIAYAEGRRMRGRHIGTEHLLIGLLHEGGGAAARLLAKHEVTLERVRQAVEGQAQAEKAKEAKAGRAEGPRELLECLALGKHLRTLAAQSATGIQERSMRPLYDFHTHTFLSDGVLSPIELIRRAIVKGYTALGIADHVGAATMKRVIKEARRDCELAQRYWNFPALAGVELTHVPAASIAELAAEARRRGATHVVVHGESPVEPVEPGTNRAAVECPEVDILAHPGLLTEEEARIAAETGVFIEITAKEGHSLGNGRVYAVAQAAGASCLLDSDTHLPDHLLTPSFAEKVARTAGVAEEALEAVLQENPETLLERIRERGVS